MRSACHLLPIVWDRPAVGTRGTAPATATATCAWRRAAADPDRACFAAVVFMLRTSTPWELLPAQELGCGSWSTAYRRFTNRARIGLFDQLYLVLLDKLGEANRMGRGRVSGAAVDGGAVLPAAGSAGDERTAGVERLSGEAVHPARTSSVARLSDASSPLRQ
jgi:hypothetical protein